MKLRNKETGEIAEFIVHKRVEDSEDGNKVYAQVVINPDEREDYEEPKEYWFIDIRYPKVEPKKDINLSNSMRKRLKEIGNYFETKEEAEKAVEKLKAWKRLKDKGFRFNNCRIEMSEITVPEITITAFIDTEEPETLNLVDLLFGGEE